MKFVLTENVTSKKIQLLKFPPISTYSKKMILMKIILTKTGTVFHHNQLKNQ